MINELCEQFGYSRKQAIKLLNAKAGWGGNPSVAKGRPAVNGAAVVEVLLKIWQVRMSPRLTTVSPQLGRSRPRDLHTLWLWGKLIKSNRVAL